MLSETKKIFFLGITKKVINIVFVAIIFLIIKVLLLPSWHHVDKERSKLGERITIKNYSFETWAVSPQGNLFPEYFTFINSPGASMERSQTAKTDKYSILLRQSPDGKAYLRYQVDDFKKYKGEKIKLSAWIKSDQKASNAVALDIQDGVSPVKIKAFPNNREWEQDELTADIDKNAKFLLLTFKPADSKNAIYIDELFLQTIPRVMPIRVNRDFMIFAIIAAGLSAIIFSAICLNRKYLFNLTGKILEYFFSATNKIIGIISKIRPPAYLRGIPIALFFIYFFHLCVIFYNKRIVMEDYSTMFDYLWYFYHRIQQGFFAFWNPYSLLGRIAVQFNMVGVSMFTPFLLFSEFTLQKLMITNVLGIFLVFLSVYLTGRILRYDRFYSLVPIILFSAHTYFKSAACSFLYTFLFFYPIAVAFLVYNLFKNEHISFQKILLFTVLLSISFTGCRLDFIIYALTFIVLIFLIFGLYQLSYGKRMWKFFLLGISAIAVALLANAWHLSLVLNAFLDNARVSIKVSALKLFDPLFIKWVAKDLIYQSSFLLCFSNVLLYKVLKPEIRLKKISFKSLFAITVLEFIILGLMVYLQPPFGTYYESVINNNYGILLFQFFALLFMLSIIHFWDSKIKLGKLLIVLASFFAGFYIVEQTLLNRILAYYDTRFYSRLFIGMFQFIAFFSIVLGSYSFAVRRKKAWFLTVLVAYLFISETGPFFLTEMFGIPWISVRVHTVAVPFLTILIIEGVSCLAENLPLLLKRIFSNLKSSDVTPVVTTGVKLVCFLIAFPMIKMVFTPSAIINKNLVYYGGLPFAAETSAKEVINNIKGNKFLEDSPLYEAYKNATLIRHKYGPSNHFKRVFVGNTVQGYSDHEYHKFFPAYSQTINTVPIYSSDIPRNLVNIFNEIYNKGLIAHPSYDGANRVFFAYKKDDCKKKNINFNADYGSTVTIKPNLSNYNNPLYAEILAREDSKTPRAFLSDKIRIFNDYMDEYKYLKNNIAIQGLSLTGQITTSDKKFHQIIKNDEKIKLEYDLKFKKDDPEYIILDITSNKDAYLALMDLYSNGWQAYIDGTKIPIYRSYIGTRFISIKPGAHTIEFKYNPPFFKESLFVSLITWLVLFFSGFYLFLTKNKPTKIQ